jgi:primosomal protein N' (replication factor Y)
VPPSKLRSAIASIDETPIVDPVLFDLLRWSAEYYHHPPGEVIAAALPAPLRNGAAALETEERWALTVVARMGEAPVLSARAGRLREFAEVLGRVAGCHDARLDLAALARAPARTRAAWLGFAALRSDGGDAAPADRRRRRSRSDA